MKKLSFIFCLLLLANCKKEEPEPEPAVNTPVIVIDSTFQVNQISAKVAATVQTSGDSFISARGVCLSQSENPDINDLTFASGNGTGAYTLTLNSLNPSTTYYIRAFATNSEGTFYSTQSSFTTSAVLYTPGTGLTDIDGNSYNSVIINGQEWMAENLRVTHFTNGDALNSAQVYEFNLVETEPSWVYYWNNSSYDIPYGKLYNQITITDTRNVCPSGWHVPTNDEWLSLVNFLGGPTVAGSKMKTTGTTYWLSENSDATNSSGFNGLPGGLIDLVPKSDYMGLKGFWWTSTNSTSSTLYVYSLQGTGTGISSNDGGIGNSIRCIKD